MAAAAAEGRGSGDDAEGVQGVSTLLGGLGVGEAAREGGVSVC